MGGAGDLAKLLSDELIYQSPYPLIMETDQSPSQYVSSSEKMTEPMSILPRITRANSIGFDKHETVSKLSQAEITNRAQQAGSSCVIEAW